MIEKFLKEIKELGAAEETVKGYGYDLSKFSVWLKENKIMLSSISIGNIASFRSKLLESLSPISVNRILACLKSFFRFLFKFDHIKMDLAKKIDLIPIGDKDPPVVLSPQEQGRFISVAESGLVLKNKTRTKASVFERLRNVALTRILLANPRVSEISALDLEDVIITGRGRGEAISLRINGKGRRLRRVPLDLDTKKVLLDYLDARDIYIQTKLPKEVALFVGRNIYTVKNLKTMRLGSRGIQQIISKISSSAGIAGITPHRFRATHITDSIRAGDRIDLVAARCGNSIGVIQDHYNKISPTDQQESVDKLQAWRNKITQQK